MADPLVGRGTRRGRARASSRASSSQRSSGVFDDHLHPASLYAPSLRTVDSRFSLNEQFAATRRDYEFGFDDAASSIFDPMSVASEYGEGDDTVGADARWHDGEGVGDVDGDGALADEDYYDLLCLPRHGAVTPQQIREAYYRLLMLFHKERHPDSQRRLAQRYLGRVQSAFETLIDPHKRAEYDAREPGDAALEQETPDEAGKEASSGGEVDSDDAAWQPAREDIYMTSDIGVRFDATKLVARTAPSSSLARRRTCPAVKPLDFTLSHSVTVGVPGLGPLLEKKIRSVRHFVRSGMNKVSVGFPSTSSDSKPPTIVTTNNDIMTFRVPTLTVSGSVYGLVDEMFLTPLTLLSDRYQPLLPQTIPRRRVMQLAETKLSPLITLKLRQEIHHKSTAGRPSSTVVEVERDVLPEPSTALRLSHVRVLPRDTRPTVLEASVRTPRRWLRTKPRISLAAHREVLHHGTTFARLDSGDWSPWPGDTCKFLSEFSRLHRRFFYAEFPLQTAPSVELGFTTARTQRVPFGSHDDAPRGDAGLRGLDREVSSGGTGSWTVSAAGSPDAVGAFVRYGRDLFVARMPRQKSPARVEVEFCANTRWDQYLAVRNLWRVGRFSRVGLEAGVSLHSFHLSLYLSRLGQRISLPFLIAPRAALSSEVIFWTGLVPFLAMAGLQLMSVRRQRGRRRQLDGLSREELARYVAQRRTIADELTVLMAGPVEVRQRLERQRSGLVILSAKYGVREAGSATGWAGEETADVTIAVAALVDDGTLAIPRGVRKGNLMGFWDPAPLAKKTLLVRYVYHGRENVVEVQGREALVLPPVS